MKLYVVGEDTPDPKNWSIWSEWELVIAPDAATALTMATSPTGKFCEIPMDKPLHLVAMSEPAWGDDI